MTLPPLGLCARLLLAVVAVLAAAARAEFDDFIPSDPLQLPVAAGSAAVLSHTARIFYQEPHFHGHADLTSKNDPFLWVDHGNVSCQNAAAGGVVVLDPHFRPDALPVNVLFSPRFADCVRVETLRFADPEQATRRRRRRSASDGGSEDGFFYTAGPSDQGAHAFGYFRLEKSLGGGAFRAKELSFYENFDIFAKVAGASEHAPALSGPNHLGRRGSLGVSVDISFAKKASAERGGLTVEAEAGCADCVINAGVSWSLEISITCQWFSCSNTLVIEGGAHFSTSITPFFGLSAAWEGRREIFKLPYAFKFRFGGINIGFLSGQPFFGLGIAADIAAQSQAQVRFPMSYSITPYSARIVFKDYAKISETFDGGKPVFTSSVDWSLTGSVTVGLEFRPMVGFELASFGVSFFEAAAGVNLRLEDTLSFDSTKARTAECMLSNAIYFKPSLIVTMNTEVKFDLPLASLLLKQWCLKAGTPPSVSPLPPPTPSATPSAFPTPSPSSPFNYPPVPAAGSVTYNLLQIERNQHPYFKLLKFRRNPGALFPAVWSGGLFASYYRLQENGWISPIYACLDGCSYTRANEFPTSVPVESRDQILAMSIFPFRNVDLVYVTFINNTIYRGEIDDTISPPANGSAPLPSLLKRMALVPGVQSTSRLTQGSVALYDYRPDGSLWACPGLCACGQWYPILSGLTGVQYTRAHIRPRIGFDDIFGLFYNVATNKDEARKYVITKKGFYQVVMDPPAFLRSGLVLPAVNTSYGFLLGRRALYWPSGNVVRKCYVPCTSSFAVLTMDTEIYDFEIIPQRDGDVYEPDADKVYAMVQGGTDAADFNPWIAGYSRDVDYLPIFDNRTREDVWNNRFM